nr:hypothetical protein BaRGS_004810 [Batillaria attramentaria]
MENLQKPDLDEGQSSSVKGRLTNFADQTSMHGLAKVTSGFASYNVINVIQTYMGNPVSTVVSVEYARWGKIDLYTAADPEKVGVVEDGEGGVGNFTQFYNSMYGNCYTFNTEFDDLGISRPGLSLLLNAQEDQYTELTYTVGFKIVVHPADSMPFPEDEGIMMEIKRAGPPYGKCNTFTDEEGDHLNMYGAIYDKKYTDNVGMPPHVLPEIREQRVRPSVVIVAVVVIIITITSPTIIDAIVFIVIVIVIIIIGEPGWPNVECVQMVLKDYQAGDLGCGEICPPACERNVAKVELFFKELNYEYIVTTPAYDWYRLLGDLGGQLGLWLGFSLLTAFEFLELMAGICRHVTHKLFCRSHQGRRVDVAAAK